MMVMEFSAVKKQRSYNLGAILDLPSPPVENMILGLCPNKCTNLVNSVHLVFVRTLVHVEKPKYLSFPDSHARDLSSTTADIRTLEKLPSLASPHQKKPTRPLTLASHIEKKKSSSFCICKVYYAGDMMLAGRALTYPRKLTFRRFRFIAVVAASGLDSSTL
ncbi:hypothetical protein RJT34_28534 [Clitoria ternatea]|uniref:Uncharacterized protein n=1 Tax=Clitoria ternatea TaxID=43366 RepID=A0AAN9I938_CLITE